MNDIRRTILWVVFGFTLVLLWDQWQLHNGKAATFFPTPNQAVAKKQGVQNTAGVASTVPVASTGMISTSTAQGNPAELFGGSTATAGTRVTLDSDVLRLIVDTNGATLIKTELLKHVDNAAGVKGNGGPVVLLDSSTERVYVAQTGLIGGPFPNHKTPMSVTGERSLAAGVDQMVVRFESADVGGVRLIKTYTLRRGSYEVGVSHQWTNIGSAPVNPQLYLQLVRDGNKLAGESPFYSTFTGPAVYTNEQKFQKIEFSDIEKSKADHVKSSADGYVAMVQHYFTSAWLLPDGIKRELFTRKVDTNLFAVGMIAQSTSLNPGEKAEQLARLYVGPQEEKALEKIYPGLELVKDYGWLAILAKPLYWLLDRLHTLLGNWGWSIVGLVVLLKAAFYWLNASAYRSMAKMKAINPKVMEARERLKDKPQEMQQAMMAIYKQEKVNPMGGCFPIVIQIPVFIALYWVLLSTVEVRNAPWIGWISDLAAPDPWYLLPVFMTATSMLQTWLNPTPPDPLQAKLMWIMPLVFSVMFFFFPAGLVLYWLTNNILSISQQWLINKRMGVLGK